jgi:NAD(P)-dependent dehydrogenase (short-subunit alcohol dehydrogenase family)
MNPTYDFSGQVALVTGAGAGMGLDTACAFAAAGAAVVLADIDEDALRSATDELAAAGDAGERIRGGALVRRLPAQSSLRAWRAVRPVPSWKTLCCSRGVCQGRGRAARAASAIDVNDALLLPALPRASMPRRTASSRPAIWCGSALALMSP